MKSFFTFLCFIFFNISLFAWGPVGHDAISYIAECNLSPAAALNIHKYLPKSIVYYSMWMDEYRLSAEYKHTATWHGAAVDADLYYSEDLKNPKGDVISELENAIRLLKNYKNIDDSVVALNIKYIIHMVADMHCLVHIKYSGIKMRFDVMFSGVKYKYHDFWDNNVIETYHKWGYIEWRQQLDRCNIDEKNRLSGGTPRQWFHESAVESRVIYDIAYRDCELGKEFFYVAVPLAEIQILKAGYRLAGILNDIFG